MEFLGERMRRAALNAGLTNVAIAEHLEITEGAFRHYLSNRSEPKLGVLVRFARLTGCPIEDLLGIDPREEIRGRSVDFERSEFVTIDQLDVQLSAGPGRIADEPTVIGQTAFRLDWLNRHGIRPDEARLVSVFGESMEPTLFSGDVVLIDFRQRSISRKGIYAVAKDDALVVKRLEEDLENKKLLLLSDNPDHPTSVLNLVYGEKSPVLGRVVWSAHTWPDRG